MQYLGGVESLADFENWFVPILWDIDDEDELTREQAGNIHILLAELSRGDLTTDEFRSRLADTIRTSYENYYGAAGSSAESYGPIRVAA